MANEDKEYKMDSKTINSEKEQELKIVDPAGRKMIVLTAKQGKPALLFYDGKGKIRAWATLTAKGTLDIRAFDESGKVYWEYETDNNEHWIMEADSDHPLGKVEIIRRRKKANPDIPRTPRNTDQSEVISLARMH
jgi:hypothetical protein